MTAKRSPRWLIFLTRGAVVFLIASTLTVPVYFTMKAMLIGPQRRAQLQKPHPAAAPPATAERSKLFPRRRRAAFPHGLGQLVGTIAFVIFATLVGRYIFRLRL